MDKRKLILINRDNEVSLYRIVQKSLKNRYFILSSEKSCQLMAYPEIVSIDAYLALLAPTEHALRFMKAKGVDHKLEICTILRGGLNYPLEEAGYRAEMKISNIHFLSCERIIENHVITGLEIKYSKHSPTDGVTLMIGDILASGMTFDLCIRQLIDTYRNSDCSIQRILFFTIGGTRAFDIFEQLTAEIQQFWPEFEGIDCFFYEGVFSVYEEKGVLGFQVPDIDFYWNGGLIAPEFRKYCMERCIPILEKCIIYDGGARRYNIPEHREEVLEYWNKILQNAKDIDLVKLFDERVGYLPPKGFDEWLQLTGYGDLDQTEMDYIYQAEVKCRKQLSISDLQQIATTRIERFITSLAAY